VESRRRDRRAAWDSSASVYSASRALRRRRIPGTQAGGGRRILCARWPGRAGAKAFRAAASADRVRASAVEVRALGRVVRELEALGDGQVDELVTIQKDAGERRPPWFSIPDMASKYVVRGAAPASRSWRAARCGREGRRDRLPTASRMVGQDVDVPCGDPGHFARPGGLEAAARPPRLATMSGTRASIRTRRSVRSSPWSPSPCPWSLVTIPASDASSSARRPGAARAPHRWRPPRRGKASRRTACRKAAAADTARAGRTRGPRRTTAVPPAGFHPLRGQPSRQSTPAPGHDAEAGARASPCQPARTRLGSGRRTRRTRRSGRNGMHGKRGDERRRRVAGLPENGRDCPRIRRQAVSAVLTHAVPCGYSPVRMLACEGSVNTACAWAKSKRTPSDASLSSAGVDAGPP